MSIKYAFAPFNSVNIYWAFNMCKTLWTERQTKDNSCPTGIYNLGGEREKRMEGR